eukprot:m51a1_g6184 putative protein tyrosine kinase (1121) ;mRNA; f:40599-46272
MADMEAKVAAFNQAQQEAEARARGFYAAVNAEFKKLDDIVLALSSQRKELARLSDELRAAAASGSAEARSALQQLDRDSVSRRLSDLNKLIAPDYGGVWARMFLGKVNAKVYREGERYVMKNEYEKFKNKQLLPFLVLVFFSAYLHHSVIAHTLLQVWSLFYFSSLALRENLLRVNGSTIRTWWVTHHYLSSVLSLVFIVWPVSSATFQEFQPVFFYYCVCQALVQFLLNAYQRQRLYNLVALGKASPMDVTGEASVPTSSTRCQMHIMVLYPFVLFVQGFQLYCCYVLSKIAWRTHIVDWEVAAAAVLFAILFCGNFITTNFTYFEKYRHWRRHSQSTTPRMAQAAVAASAAVKKALAALAAALAVAVAAERLTFNTTEIYWTGGETCGAAACGAYEWEASYACSNGVGEWMDGVRVFQDPTPRNVPKVITGLAAHVTGSFNCDLDKDQSHLMMLVQRTALRESIALPDTGGCICPNCASTITIKADGQYKYNEYNQDGANRIIALPSDSFICLSKIKITVECEILNPVVFSVAPSCGPVEGGTLIEVSGANYPRYPMPVYCLFDGLQYPAVYKPNATGVILCETPPFSHEGLVTVGVKYDFYASNGLRLESRGPALSQFLYTEGVRLTRVTPSYAAPDGSVQLVIEGENIDYENDRQRYYVTCSTPVWNTTGTKQTFVALLDITLNGQQYSSTLQFKFRSTGGISPAVLQWSIIGSSCCLFVVVFLVLAAYMRYRHSLDGYERIREGNFEIDYSEVKVGPRIGKGTFGEVFRGTWRGAVIAIKKMPANDMSDVMLHEFNKEITLMRSMRHPNVLQFLGSCLEPPNICILFEYMGRGSLYSILHNPAEHFDWPLLLGALCDTSRGVLYLHSSKPPIIHRDLKSHNLLVDENWKVKVSDFGLSTIMEQASQTMTACGTPCWTAPEVLKHLHYSQKADVYSFSIVMWECLTRRDPYAGMPPFKVIFAVGNEGLRPALPSYTPPEFASLVRDCWDESPLRRPSFEVILERMEAMTRLGWSGDPFSGLSTPARSVSQSPKASSAKDIAASPGAETSSPPSFQLVPKYVSPAEMLGSPASPTLVPVVSQKQRRQSQGPAASGSKRNSAQITAPAASGSSQKIHD